MLHRRIEQQTPQSLQADCFVLIFNGLCVLCPLRHTAERQAGLWTFCASNKDFMLPVQLLSQLGETQRVAVQMSLRQSAVSVKN